MKIKAYMISIMKDERKTPDAYIVKVFLSIVSLIYMFVSRCIYFFYKAKILRSYKVPVKVISIGNITLGGTGKTPFAIKLAEDVKSMGKRVAVLSRGYGKDESHLLEEKLKDTPILVGRNRVKNATRAHDELGSDCVILDDGFQHYRIRRDLDLVLIDSTIPFGNMQLFPRGILREPLERMEDADIAILTKSDMGRNNIASIRTLLKKANKKMEIAESFYQPLDFRKVVGDKEMPLSYITDKKVAILAGIANPDYFDWIVSNLGAGIAEKFHYPDHHPYCERDIAHIAKRCLAKGINIVITTEKDAIRLERLKNIPAQIEILALRIDFKINSNEEAIVGRLHSIFNS
jgi:tetraacyldisaccharide 4'-kinase